MLDRRRSVPVSSDRLSNTNNQGPAIRTSGHWVGGASGGTAERAVVLTLTVAIAGILPLIVAGLGEIVQVAASGTPLQVNDTAPLNPFEPVSVSGNVAVCPAEMV
jgi:hypothetical protein